LSLAWDNNTKTGSQILTDVLNMVKASIAKNHRGPWMMYIPTDYQTAIDKDYDTTTPGTTIRERILKVTGIEGIKTADRLPDDTVLLVEMKSDTVRLIDGIPLQNVQWGTEGNFITKYKVLTIQVPQIRSDRNGQCGIVQLAA
jgi:hypothetical protein